MASLRVRSHGLGLVAASTPVLGLLLIPLIGLLSRTAPAAVVGALAAVETRQAIELSLWTSAVATALVVVLGTPVAFMLKRPRWRGRALVEVLVDLPTVLPPAVAGLALLMAFGRRGLLGGLLDGAGLQLAFTPAAVIIAQMFVAAPYFIKTAAVALAGVDAELEDAARVDGATALQVVRRITLPLAWRGVLGGAALCWARALGEFGATIIFAGNYPGRTQTMPLAVYIGFEISLDRALTLSAILLGVSFLVLTVVRLMHRQVR